jgi:microcystin-dependent protein
MNMGTPFVAQLLLASWNVIPKGYASCNGALVAISTNQALFALIGTIYGGNGQTNFALPNLQGRTPISFSSQFVIGSLGGTDYHTLISGEVPTHTHALQGSTSPASSPNPSANIFGNQSGSQKLYTPAGNPAVMNPATIANSGGSQPHENRQPFLVLNWCIALTGLFPSRN